MRFRSAISRGRIRWPGLSPVESDRTGLPTAFHGDADGHGDDDCRLRPDADRSGGRQAEYIYSLPVTLSVTLGISWLLAMTFCAVLAAAFIRAPKDRNQPSAPLPWLAAKCGALIRRRKGGSDSDQKGDFIGNTLGLLVGGVVKCSLSPHWSRLACWSQLFHCPSVRSFFQRTCEISSSFRSFCQRQPQSLKPMKPRNKSRPFSEH